MSEEVPVSKQESPNTEPDLSAVQETQPVFNSDSEQKLNNDIEQEIGNNLENTKLESDDLKDPASSGSDNEARLQQLEKEHETLRSQYMRIAADFDNFRKRQTRDQDDLRQQLTCNTLGSILPVVDNFERARQQLEPQGEEAQALHRSYQGLYKQLVEVLKQLGVAPMRVIGQSFDPTLHEAVLREPSDEQSEDKIIEELQRGYHLNGRVLRHALVKVSMGPGPQTESSEQPVETDSKVVLNDDSESIETSTDV